MRLSATGYTLDELIIEYKLAVEEVKKIKKAQEYGVGSRSLKRGALKEALTDRDYWAKEIQKLKNGNRGQIISINPSNL